MKKLFSILSIMMLFSIGTGQVKLLENLVLDGKIDKYDVRMILYKSNYDSGNLEYTGYYYYNSQKIPIYLYQTDYKGDMLQLTVEYDYNSVDETGKEIFDGKLKNGIYSGVWKKDGKNLNFELKPADKNTYSEIGKYSSARKAVVPIKNSNENLEGDYEIQWFLPKDPDLQRSFMKEAGIDNYTSFTVNSKEILDEFERNYKKEAGDLSKDIENVDEILYFLNYSFNSYISPVLNDTDYLVMSYTFYSYTGGAHGMSSVGYYTYDRNKKKWLKLSDVLDLNKEAGITQAINKEIRKQYKIPEGKKYSEYENPGLYVDEVPISDNFTLSKKGVTFHYGLYEVAPYVAGFFEITVPYESLKPYLKKGFKY